MSSARRQERPEAATPASALHPPPVIRGESQVAKVDWLNATFPRPSFSVEAFIAILGRIYGRPVAGDESRGVLGFESSVQLRAMIGSKWCAIGCIAMGGEAQRGRWLLQLTGEGCGLVRDWDNLADLLESMDARLTRVDLAVDFLHGEYSVDDAVNMHAIGGFTSSGRPPSTSVAGDWFGGVNGRTFYVGRRENGKCLRVYEKGLQLGDELSEWVRFEVQLGNRDRVIPFEALTNRDAYFAGTYPAMADLVCAAAQRIPTQQQQGAASMAHLLYHLKRCFGKALDTAVRELQCNPATLVDELRIVGLPRRVNPSSVAAGLEWAQVLARLKVKS